MALDRARSLAVEPQQTGRRLVGQHVIAEDEFDAIRDRQAISFGLSIAA